MTKQREHEAAVLEAVKKLVQSMKSSPGSALDMSAVTGATSQLSLVHLQYWESLFANEFCSTLANPSPKKWAPWRKQVAHFPTWLDLCSRDGFKREKTLRTLLGGAPNAFFFALATRRLNDWVPQVRAAAREAIPAIAKATNPEHVADVLCAVFPHWSSWGRIQKQDVDVFLEIAAHHEVTLSLRARILSAPSGPMPSILSQVGRMEILDRYLREFAKSSIQPAVRARAYKYLLERNVTWFGGRKWEWTDKAYCKGYLKPVFGHRAVCVTTPFIEILESAATDCSPVVRAVAVDMLIRELESKDSELLNLAKRLASDSSSAVAARGQFALKQLIETKPAGGM